MQKAVRIILGIVVVGVVLHLADLATRDCRVAPYVYDDCMWMSLRTHLGLPANRFLRMAALECVGIILALVLYLTARYLLPFRRSTRPGPDASSRAPQPDGPPS